MYGTYGVVFVRIYVMYIGTQTRYYIAGIHKVNLYSISQPPSQPAP